MSVELQIRATVLRRAAARTTRRLRRSTCLPVVPGASVDHLEVVHDGVAVSIAGAAVEVTFTNLQDASVPEPGALGLLGLGLLGLGAAARRRTA